MSVRADSGVCKYCGTVMLVAQLERIDELQPAVDAYTCPECVSEAPRKGADA